MSRGQYLLFTDIFENTNKAVNDPRPRNYYMPLRNEHLAYRYYYYAEVKFIRYDKCLQLLETEFYLCEARIVVLLSELTELLRKIVETKPTVKELEKKIPHLNW